MSNTIAIKVSAPPGLVEAIDAEVAKGGYTGRGDFALFAIRYYLERIRDEELGYRGRRKRRGHPSTSRSSAGLPSAFGAGVSSVPCR
ncbi:MAG: ribbon-helix-helix domain-containing protein [Candidatus Methanomethylophilus sp.]|nr:ribbon-helix-helix domain-containing protein [Methanomethylophilus sp.]